MIKLHKYRTQILIALWVNICWYVEKGQNLDQAICENNWPEEHLLIIFIR